MMNEPIQSHPVGRPLASGEWPDFIVIEAALKKQLLALPQTERTWHGSRRSTGTRIRGAAMDVVLWVETDSTEFMACEAVVEGTEPTSILNNLFVGMRDPQTGPPYRPARVFLNDPELVDHLQPYVASIGVEVAYSSSSASVDQAFKRLKFLNRDHVNPN